MMRKQAAWVRSFLRDTRGNLTVMFALTLIPMAIAGGGMLDFARLTKSQATLANIADSAVLAGVRDDVVTAAIPWSEQKAASEKAIKDTFALFLATNKDKSLTLVSDTYTVSFANNVVTAKLCYTAKQSNSMLQFAGMKSNTFSGCSTAESAPPTYFSVNFLVDASGSMGIGATADDQALMNQQMGCAFACHTQDGLHDTVRRGAVGHHDRAVRGQEPADPGRPVQLLGAQVQQHGHPGCCRVEGFG